MYCKKCGTEINENQNFCPKCGEKLNDIEKNKTENMDIEKVLSKPKLRIIFLVSIMIASVVLGGCFLFSKYDLITPKKTAYESFVENNVDIINSKALNNINYEIIRENSEKEYSIDREKDYLISAYELNESENMITVTVNLENQKIIIDLYACDNNEYILKDTFDLNGYNFTTENIVSNFALYSLENNDFYFVLQWKDAYSELHYSCITAFSVEDKFITNNEFIYTCSISDFGNEKEAFECENWSICDNLKGETISTYEIEDGFSKDMIYQSKGIGKSSMLVSSNLNDTCKDYLLCAKDIKDIELESDLTLIFKGNINANDIKGDLSFVDYTFN